MKKGCSNKHCPQGCYQEGLEDEKDLCPVCYQQYKNDQFCVYCKQIYFESTDDGKAWIECDECNGWVHAECADVNLFKNNVPNTNISFKCIKCKKV